MKKLLLVLALCLTAVSVNAQDWALGGRIGNGIQFDAQYHTGNKTYIEGRFGASYYGYFGADLTVLHNWNIVEWADWTPEAGKWFFDAGVGGHVGGGSNFAYLGVSGMAKFGIGFYKVPIDLTLDWTPSIGVAFTGSDNGVHAGFNGWGFGNFGITVVYHL